MGHLEEKFLETCELKPWVWWRFLDDIFVIWFHSEEDPGVKLFFASFEFFSREYQVYMGYKLS
jgi:hypothetical protein